VSFKSKSIVLKAEVLNIKAARFDNNRVCRGEILDDRWPKKNGTLF